jgi:geranylgeranyl diphosphate synthase, type I
MAGAADRRELTRLMHRSDIDDDAVQRWTTLIVTTGAAQYIEDMISLRVSAARKELHDMALDDAVRTALAEMASACTERVE